MRSLLVGAVLLAVMAVIVSIRRRWLAKETEAIDAAIRERGYRYSFEGTDEPLRHRTEARREKADAMKREGRQVETGDEPRTRFIKMVR